VSYVGGISYVRNIAFFFDKEDSCYLVKTEATSIQEQYSRGRTTGLVLGGLGVIAFIALIIAAVSGY